MKILCICKASIKEGLGHLLRSITFCDRLKYEKPDLNVELILISNLQVGHYLDNKAYPAQIFERFPSDKIAGKFDLICLDMLSLGEAEIAHLRSLSNHLVSLSPIFNRMPQCNTLITRTRYLGTPENMLPKQVLAGLDYAIIRKQVHKISRERYKINMTRNSLHVGISLGGTDPLNNTLKVIQHLKKIDRPVLFWVLLGEGYSFQYDQLVAEIKGHKNHEMILARTNKNMWEVLENCSLAILAGGLTSYEAAYAGLPAINYFAKKERSFLTQELEEKGLSISSCSEIKDLPELLNTYMDKKDLLIQVNENAQSYQPFSKQIVEKILSLQPPQDK